MAHTKCTGSALALEYNEKYLDNVKLACYCPSCSQTEVREPTPYKIVQTENGYVAGHTPARPCGARRCSRCSRCALTGNAEVDRRCSANYTIDSGVAADAGWRLASLSGAVSARSIRPCTRPSVRLSPTPRVCIYQHHVKCEHDYHPAAHQHQLAVIAVTWARMAMHARRVDILVLCSSSSCSMASCSSAQCRSNSFRRSGI